MMLFNSRLLVAILTLSAVVIAAVAEVQLQQRHIRGLAGNKESSNNNNSNNGKNNSNNNGKTDNGSNNNSNNDKDNSNGNNGKTDNGSSNNNSNSSNGNADSGKDNSNGNNAKADNGSSNNNSSSNGNGDSGKDNSNGNNVKEDNGSSNNNNNNSSSNGNGDSGKDNSNGRSNSDNSNNDNSNGKDNNGDNSSNGKDNSRNNGNSDMDGPVKGPENEPQKQGQGEDCAPGPNHITNAGSNSKGVFFKRTSQSRKLSTTQSIDTSNAFSSYQSQDLYQFARSLQSGLKYMWDNAKYQDSCYDYDIILGFAEIDEEVCKGNKKRIFSVDVNVGGGGPIDIVTDLNVAEKAGGCYKAITVKTTVTPMTKNIDIQFKKSKNSDYDEPMVSFIAIVRQENRRLGSKCDENAKLLPTV